jgi:hypothetical protein
MRGSNWHGRGSSRVSVLYQSLSLSSPAVVAEASGMGERRWRGVCAGKRENVSGVAGGRETQTLVPGQRPDTALPFPLIRILNFEFAVSFISRSRINQKI